MTAEIDDLFRRFQADLGPLPTESRRRILARPIASRPMATAPTASAPMAMAASASEPIAVVPTACAPVLTAGRWVNRASRAGRSASGGVGAASMRAI